MSTTRRMDQAEPVTLGPTSEVPVGARMFYETVNVVVTQPEEGIFKAFTLVCPHRGCHLDTFEYGQIVCPCHGSRFWIVDGSVAHGPATVPLDPKTITIKDGEILLHESDEDA